MGFLKRKSQPADRITSENLVIVIKLSPIMKYS